MISWEEHLKTTYDYLPEEIEGFAEDDNPEVKRLHEVKKHQQHNKYILYNNKRKKMVQKKYVE